MNIYQALHPSKLPCYIVLCIIIPPIATSQLRVPTFNPELGLLSVWGFTCSPVYLGFFWVSSQISYLVYWDCKILPRCKWACEFPCEAETNCPCLKKNGTCGDLQQVTFWSNRTTSIVVLLYHSRHPLQMFTGFIYTFYTANFFILNIFFYFALFMFFECFLHFDFRLKTVTLLYSVICWWCLLRPWPIGCVIKNWRLRQKPSVSLWPKRRLWMAVTP